MIRLCYAIITLGLLISYADAATPLTFCNPVNLDYGMRQVHDEPPHRHGADPCIVLFQDKYWLFSTWDRPGYRVSDDLVHWKYIPFGPVVELPSKTYTAAAAVVMNGWIYFTEFGRASKPVAVYRTREPASGKWEKVSGLLPPYADPCLFLDPKSGKLFMYAGLDKPIHGVELDKTNFTEIDGTKTQVGLSFDPAGGVKEGWEVCTWDNSEASTPMRGNKTFNPCREGSWMTYYGGKYYLQYASPGTTVPGYADGLLMGDNPLGPFTYSMSSPISHKDSGFITSAGHSCLFQDRYGNWWRAVTMLIGIHERMERRIGLFPAGFDSDGVPFTRTEMDTPIVVPAEKRDPLGDVYSKWQIISLGHAMTASSSLEGHAPEMAGDEDIRTWWSAKSGNAGEWIEMDLASVRTIDAVQVNLFEQDCSADLKFEQDQHQFVLAGSEDGKSWKTLLDRASATDCSPHTYVAFDSPVHARLLKVTCVSMPANGKFAVSDLRVFGRGEGPLPASAKGVVVNRDDADRRKVDISWNNSDGATSYLIRYGIDRSKLYQTHLLRGGDVNKTTLYSLNVEPPYFFRVDALNESGVTIGDDEIEAK